MIEQFAVPDWVRVLVRLSRRYLCRWTRVAPAPGGVARWQARRAARIAQAVAQASPAVFARADADVPYAPLRLPRAAPLAVATPAAARHDPHTNGSSNGHRNGNGHAHQGREHRVRAAAPAMAVAAPAAAGESNGNGHSNGHRNGHAAAARHGPSPARVHTAAALDAARMVAVVAAPGAATAETVVSVAAVGLPVAVAQSVGADESINVSAPAAGVGVEIDPADTYGTTGGPVGAAALAEDDRHHPAPEAAVTDPPPPEANDPEPAARAAADVVPVRDAAGSTTGGEAVELVEAAAATAGSVEPMPRASNFQELASAVAEPPELVAGPQSASDGVEIPAVLDASSAIAAVVPEPAVAPVYTGGPIIDPVAAAEVAAADAEPPEAVPAGAELTAGGAEAMGSTASAEAPISHEPVGGLKVAGEPRPALAGAGVEAVTPDPVVGENKVDAPAAEVVPEPEGLSGAAAASGVVDGAVEEAVDSTLVNAASVAEVGSPLALAPSVEATEAITEAPSNDDSAASSEAGTSEPASIEPVAIADEPVSPPTPTEATSATDDAADELGSVVLLADATGVPTDEDEEADAPAMAARAVVTSRERMPVAIAQEEPEQPAETVSAAELPSEPAVPTIAAAAAVSAIIAAAAPAAESPPSVVEPAARDREPSTTPPLITPPLPRPKAPPASSVLAPAVEAEYNRTGLDYRRPMPRPKVVGPVIDFHCHLLAARHAPAWFEAADHYGIDCFMTMSPLEEVMDLQRDWGHRLQFIAVPKWGDASANWVDDWLTRLEAFYNVGSRIVKFHAAPGTMAMRGHRLDHPAYAPLFREVVDRRMVIMTHIGDPDTWYAGKYAEDPAKYGTRDEHYAMWEGLLEAHRGTPWLGAHLGGNPEDLPRLQRLLDRFPDLVLDCSATRWMAREVSARRDAAREFFIRNEDRILFGSDQVSFDDRGFDFLASRFWAHRKLWETAYVGPAPIRDPDLPEDQQPTLRGLALPDGTLQKLYHDNAIKLLAKVGATFGGWG